MGPGGRGLPTLEEVEALGTRFEKHFFILSASNEWLDSVEDLLQCRVVNIWHQLISR
jgi:hypothetical protein